MSSSGSRRPLWVRLGLAVGAMVALVEIGFGVFLVWRVGDRTGLARDELIGLAMETAAVGGVALATVCVGVFVLARRLGRRIEGITHGAERFARGDLRHRIESPPSRELAALTGALNEMAVQLSAQIAKLRAQQNEVEAVLRSMEGGLLAISAEQDILRINRIARRMLRLKDGDLRGKRLGDVVEDPALRRFAADAIADPSRRTDEFSIGTDTRVLVRATSGALLDADDEPVGAIILLTDVTQLKRLESVRSDFAANVSHELRTPITNIKGYAETLLESGLSEGDMSLSFLRVIARNAERLGAIVDDMLALTNLERTEGLTLATSETPVDTLVRSVQSQIGKEATERGITIATDLAPGLCAMVNARLAEQALVNLVGNAVKYSADGTTVTIRSRGATLDEGAGVELSVEDQGPGIAPAHLPRIFERFYRVDKARSREQGGTGLGLSIVKHIALVHGGQVSVDSRVGEGSTFRLVFPAGEMRSDSDGVARLRA